MWAGRIGVDRKGKERREGDNELEEGKVPLG
jgi:hypothetical protein